MFRPDLPDSRKGFYQEPDAVLEAATISVSPMVAMFGKKTLRQIAVGKM
jgi:hypothetical protein